MNDNGFEVGDKVLLTLPNDVLEDAPQGLKRWDRCTFRISRKKHMCGGNVYELKACRSVEGVPYSVLEDWIMLTR